MPQPLLSRMMRGKILTIEGADGSGKATQTTLLVKRLKAEGKNVKTLDFPQYDSFFGQHVAKFLRGEYGSLDEVHPELASMLFAFDRYGMSRKLRAWLESGHIIVLNRYMESNMAHQGAKIFGRERRRDFISWLYELEVERLGIPRSDLVIYLHVPTDISQRIIRGRENKDYLQGKKKDINEEDVEYQRRSVKTYLELCEQFPHWRKVQCTEGGKLKSIGEIHELIWGLVQQEL